MSQNLYIIQQIGYEYNDETYYRPESGGGKAIVAYTSKSKAEKECKKRNLQELKTLGNLGSFCYEAEDLINDPTKLGLPHNQMKELFSYDGGNVIGQLTDKQLENILDLCDLNFFEVVEVKKGD